MLTKEERRLRAQIAAHTRWANEDREKASERQRRVILRRFEDEVDPDRVLSPSERAKRANNAMSAHMNRLAFKAVQARKAKAKRR